MPIFSFVADVISILGSVFALFAWVQTLRLRRDQKKERVRQNRKISTTLHYGEQQLALPVEIRRADLTRAELLGRLGMIPLKPPKDRFSIRYLNISEFYRQLDQIMAGDSDMTLLIPCTKEEFEQFDVQPG